MAYNTCLRSSAPGHTGRQLDNLLARLNASLLLEDGSLGGDNNSFAIVPLGGGGRCTPTGISSGKSFTLCLPPHGLLCASRGVSGGGGGDWNRESSASPSLGPRVSDSLSPTPVSGNSRQCARPEEFASLESKRPSLARQSGAAWDLARVGMQFDQGTGATSTRPPPLSSLSPRRRM
jgi:hypothetical protein